jgi:hypothetical protein
MRFETKILVIIIVVNYVITYVKIIWYFFMNFMRSMYTLNYIHIYLDK